MSAHILTNTTHKHQILISGIQRHRIYLLLRLILLLDRTICRIYDLPVWSRFTGVLRQAGRRRSVCALSVFGLLFLLPALLLTRPGTLLRTVSRSVLSRTAQRC